MSSEINSPDEFNELTQDQKDVLTSWVSHFDMIKTINTRHTSYGLKHKFENSQNGFYITNGQFKGAMREQGFKFKQPLDSPNESYNISEASVKTLIALNRQ